MKKIPRHAAHCTGNHHMISQALPASWLLEHHSRLHPGCVRCCLAAPYSLVPGDEVLDCLILIGAQPGSSQLGADQGDRLAHHLGHSTPQHSTACRIHVTTQHAAYMSLRRPKHVTQCRAACGIA